jgi:hypothetical protein
MCGKHLPETLVCVDQLHVSASPLAPLPAVSWSVCDFFLCPSLDQAWEHSFVNKNWMVPLSWLFVQLKTHCTSKHANTRACELPWHLHAAASIALAVFVLELVVQHRVATEVHEQQRAHSCSQRQGQTHTNPQSNLVRCNLLPGDGRRRNSSYTTQKQWVNSRPPQSLGITTSLRNTRAPETWNCVVNNAVAWRDGYRADMIADACPNPQLHTATIRDQGETCLGNCSTD